MFYFQALIHGLNRHYYSIAINYRKNELEQKVGSICIMFKTVPCNILASNALQDISLM